MVANSAGESIPRAGGPLGPPGRPRASRRSRVSPANLVVAAIEPRRDDGDDIPERVEVAVRPHAAMEPRRDDGDD